MSRNIVARLTVAVMSAAVFVACSRQSPTTPSGSPGIVAHVGIDSHGSGGAGLYVLTFFGSVNGAPVTSLPVGQELILKAQVMDSAGSLALTGSVAFQVCSQGGKSSHMDPVPFSQCDTGGPGNWSTLRLVLPVDAGTCPPPLQPGSACLDFGAVSNPRVAGFRFKYTSQKGNIASGLSAPANFEWTAQ